MSVPIELKQSKAITKLLHDIAEENGIKFFLEGDIGTTIDKETFDNVVWFPSDTVIFRREMKSLPSPVTWEEFSIRLEKAQADVIWVYGRQSEYPSIQDQLDKIFHEGLDAWKAEIQAIKDKYPKTE
jgi:hypothetical protein